MPITQKLTYRQSNKAAVKVTRAVPYSDQHIQTYVDPQQNSQQ